MLEFFKLKIIAEVLKLLKDLYSCFCPTLVPSSFSSTIDTVYVNRCYFIAQVGKLIEKLHMYIEIYQILIRQNSFQPNNSFNNYQIEFISLVHIVHTQVFVT